MANDIIDNISVQLTLQDRMSKGMKEARKTIGKETQKIKRSFGNTNVSILRTQNLLRGLGSVVVLAGLNKLSNAAEKFEFGLVGVGKTTDIVGDKLQALGTDIQNLSFKIPVMTNQMLNIATVAGQLGVKGTNNILAFTSAISKLRLTTDLVDESFASASLARILTVTNTDLSKVENFASAIVKLGNNSAATESEILNVATRVAQTTAAFDTSAQDVAAMSATLREFGERAEAGGSAIGIFFRKMNRAIRIGGKEFAILNRVTGKSQEELLETLERNSTDAFVAILEGLKSLDAVGVENFFDDMKINTNEVNRVIVPFIKNLDKLKEKLDLSRVEFINPTELDRELEQFSKTFFARMTIFKNSITAVMVDVGQVINDNIMPALERIGNWVQQNHKSIAEGLISMVKPLILLGSIPVVKGLANLAMSLAKVQKASVATGIFKTLGFTSFTLGAGAASLAVAGVATALVKLSQQNATSTTTFAEEWSSAFKSNAEISSTWFKDMNDGLDALIDSSSDLFSILSGEGFVNKSGNAITNLLTSFSDKLTDLQNDVAVTSLTFGFLKDLAGELPSTIKGLAGTFITGDSRIMKREWADIVKLTETFQDSINNVELEKVVTDSKKTSKNFLSIVSALKQAGSDDAGTNFVRNLLDDVSSDKLKEFIKFKVKMKELREETSFLNGEFGTTSEKLFGLMQTFGLLTPTTAGQIAMLKELTKVFGELTDAEQKLIDKQTALDKIGEQFQDGLDRRASRLEEIKQITQEMLTPLELFNQKQERLNFLLGEGLSTETFERAMAKYREELEASQEKTSVFADIFDSSFKRVGDGISQALLDGQSSMETFKNFFAAFASDLIQQAFRLLVVQQILDSITGAIQNRGGGGGAGGGGDFSAGSVSGGSSPFTPRASVPVSASRSVTGGSNSVGGGGQSGGVGITIDLRGSNGDEAIREAVTRGINEATPSIIRHARIETVNEVLSINQRRPNVFGRT